MRTISDISKDLVSQDNLATAIPIFIVQQKRRIYGIDPEYTENITYLDDYADSQEVSEEKVKELEEAYSSSKNDLGNGDFLENYTRVGYIDNWEFITACFTKKGCEDYIAANGHNLTEPRIYVESGYRNREWETMREFLKNYRD